jgi:RNA polymerase sigma-70 factor (ECF subfamily)
MTVAMDRYRSPEQSELDPPDRELLRGCAAGDATAFQVLFERHQQPIAEYLYRTLENREEAEDAAVEVFLKAWRGAAAFQERATVRNWLYRIATHVAIDHLRRRQRRPVTLASFSGLEEHDPRLVAAATDQPEAALLANYQRARDRQALRRALRFLKPEDRTLIALRCFENCSYDQISEITGLSLERVRSRLHKSRERLKRQFYAMRDSDEPLEPLDEPREDPDPDPKRLLAF